MVAFEPRTDDQRLLEAMHMGRWVDEMIRASFAAHKSSYTKTAKEFGLSEAEVRYIVQYPDRRIVAGCRK